MPKVAIMVKIVIRKDGSTRIELVRYSIDTAAALMVRILAACLA